MTQEKRKTTQLALDECHLLLKSTRKPMNFRELLAAGWKKVEPEADLNGTVLANLYTNLNLDARFVPLGKGQWGLAEWQPRPARSTIPATSLMGKTYQDDRRRELAQPVGVAAEEAEIPAPVEEVYFHIDDEGEEEEWDEAEDQE